MFLRRERLYIFLLAALPWQSAWARFDHKDADEIDQEENLKRDFYNLSVGYEYPDRWAKPWRDSDIAYRVSVGNLDANYYLYEEDLKLSALSTGGHFFQFKHKKEEDPVEQRSKQELRYGYKIFDQWMAFFLADTGAFKKYGDYGFAAGYAPNPKTQRAEFFLWSVDHYYNQNEQTSGDKLNKGSYSLGVDVDWLLLEDYRIVFHHKIDTPVEWNRQSKNYLYKFSHQSTKLGVEWLGRIIGLEGFYETTKKVESKKWSVANTTDGVEDGTYSSYEKGLSRSESKLNFAMITRDTSNNSFYKLGTRVINRKADYNFQSDSGLSAADYEEGESLDQTRTETIYFGKVNYSYVPQKIYLQFGTYVSDVNMSGGQQSDRMQISFQSGVDYHLTKQTFINSNLFWDIDHMANHMFNPFKPISGFSLQFIAAF